MVEEKTDEARDARRDEAELIGRVIQSEQKLTGYFTTIITKSVTDQLNKLALVCCVTGDGKSVPVRAAILSFGSGLDIGAAFTEFRVKCMNSPPLHSRAVSL